MNGKTLITPLGQMLLKQKREDLELSILERQEALANLAQDNPEDGFQDSYVFDTQMDFQHIDQQLREITGLLSETRTASIPSQIEQVALGHKAKLVLKYPSDEWESLTILLLTSAEIPLVEKYLMNGEVPISPNSALGKAIYGRKAGTEFSFNIESGTVRGQLLDIEVWQYAFELPEFTLG